MSGSQNAPGGGNFGDGQEMNIIFLAVGIVAVGFLLGWLFYEDIVKFIFFLKFHELRVVEFFHPSQNLQAVINWGAQMHYREVKVSDLVALSKVVGDHICYPFAVVGALLGILLYLKHPDNNFKATETMDSLSAKMKDVFPAIKAVQGIDLVNQSVDKGPWRMALTPIEFAKKHKLLSRGEDKKLIVDAIRAKALLVKQLGPVWRGVEHLPPHQKALFAIFSAYINYDRVIADKALEQIAMSATPAAVKAGKLDFSMVDSLIERFAYTAQVKEVVSRHAYVLTVFSEMLRVARLTGIVANSLYLWVKPIDRPLWYTFNNVGRQAVFMETGAVRAHWMAESQLGHPIKSPVIDSVVHGLEVAINQRIIKDLT